MPEIDIYHFFQQLVNGLTIGSTYALIAIGYTMVYGIIGMINFAHGEVYMIGSYVAFIALAGLTMLGFDSLPLLITAAFVASIVVTSAYGYAIERVAYRPLRGSNRLIPLISAIGMSIVPAEHGPAGARLKRQIDPQPDSRQFRVWYLQLARGGDFLHADSDFRRDPDRDALP